MQLSLAPVKVGSPKAPTKGWGKNQVELDPKQHFLTRLKGENLLYCDDNLGNNAQVYHKNILEYMEACWKDHLGLTITPDMLWYTLLCELTQIVKEDSDKYKYLFTDSDEKQTLIVLSEDPVRMPVGDMVELLKRKVPTDTSLFLPRFSTSNPRSIHAANLAFCDMCSPYYDYCMLCCGIPGINVEGTMDDYVLIKEKWNELGKIFDGQDEYFSRVKNTLNRILDNFISSEFWMDMFRLERCGSGSDVELEGWISTFFKEIPCVGYIRNYTSGVSLMEYTNLSTEKKYKMQEGLFFSRMEGDFLVPQFGFTVHEVLDQPPLKR